MDYQKTPPAIHAAAAAPESSTVVKISDRSTRVLLQYKKSKEDLKSGNKLSKTFLENSERNAATATTDERNDKKGKSKRKKPSSAIADRPLTHGAHAVAAQDGSHIGKLLY